MSALTFEVHHEREADPAMREGWRPWMVWRRLPSGFCSLSGRYQTRAQATRRVRDLTKRQAR